MQTRPQPKKKKNSHDENQQNSEPIDSQFFLLIHFRFHRRHHLTDDRGWQVRRSNIALLRQTFVHRPRRRASNELLRPSVAEGSHWLSSPIAEAENKNKHKSRDSIQVSTVLDVERCQDGS